MSRARLLIDCDPGLDDAIALLAACHLADVVGITTVNGNVGIEHTTHNALAAVEASGLDIGVHRGAERPLIAPTMDAARVHGPTGLGSVEVPPVQRDVDSTDAVGFLLDSARSVDDLHVLAIGPLTNIALALRADPTLPSRLGGLTIMGGSASSGNVTASAEFNIWADPEAAAIVFRDGGPLTMVGLDITHQVLMGETELEQLRSAGSRPSGLAADLLEYAMARSLDMRGWSGAPIHDASALITITHPHLFDGDDHPVDVELTGSLTRGMTVIDDRPLPDGEPQTRVLRSVDAPAVASSIVDAITTLGGA
jgi:inosine-uridine nucleoside N-ribohydrolase